MRQLKISKSITNRADKSLDKYLQDISREEMITAEEEVRLAILIKEGDERAKEKLVRANLRFVVSVSKQYQNQGLTLPDLINEGNLGLIKAAGRFDETRGFKFISYAVWWIRQSILQALAEQARIVRLPLNQVGTISKINNQRIFNFKKNIFNNENKEFSYVIPLFKGKKLIEASDGFQYSTNKNYIFYYDKFSSNVFGFEFKKSKKYNNNIECDFYQLNEITETPLNEDYIGNSSILKEAKGKQKIF